MTPTATVNYHVHKPELAQTQVAVTDVRSTADLAGFEDASVGFARFPTGVQAFDSSDDWQPAYDGELTKLLADKIGAREVIVFDHTVRIDDPEAVRKPARNVHSDYSSDGAVQRLTDILGADKAADWSKGHYAFINVWRPVEAAINSAPLGFICPSSVATQDWILLDLIYPDRKGQIFGLAANPDHDWFYMSKMKPDEVAYFNIYDNQGRPSIAHSALDMVEDPSVQTIRKSIESRTLVRY